MRRGLFLNLRARDERGVIAVLTAILLVAMFSLVALVIDIAALRADARAGQTTGDFAAVAAGLALDPTTLGSPNAACQAAYQYFLANTPGLTGLPATASQCDAVFPAGIVCNPLVANEAIIPVGPYTVRIIWPIPDSHPLMQGRVNPNIDGDPCSRIAVQVGRSRGYLFGGIVNAFQGQTNPPAVARSAPTETSDVTAALILLDPYGCKSLYTSGQGSAWVQSTVAGPGIITVDSNGTFRGSGDRDCRPDQDYTIDAVGTINAKIVAGASSTACNPADGRIVSFALWPGQTRPDASYDPRDVNLCSAGYGIAPRPTAGPRITRSPIDHRYNCKGSYPSFFGVAIAPCDDPPAPYIDQLVASVGTGTGDPPPGFQEAVGAGRPIPNCAPNVDIVVPAGNWYVSCTTNSAGQGLQVDRKLVFTSQSNIVFEGGVNVGVDGTLCINVIDTANCNDVSAPGPDGFVYFRKGDRSSTAHFVKDAQASVVLMRTFVYQENGYVSFGAGSGRLVWVAPFAGNFEDLSLWSERADLYLLGGQARLNLEGTFFTPFANPFTFSGQPGFNQTKAQFFTYRLNIGGQGTLVMAPDPERSTPIPLAGVLLIR